jgi:glycosyltransferase involved in cell wall biosynthesis
VGQAEFLAINDNPATIAARINEARNSPPAAQNRRLARAADFSWKRIALMYREFLQEVITGSIKQQQ